MGEVKSVRVRPSNANVDERLGMMFDKSSGLKGAISDIKVTLYDENTNWKIEWLPIGKAQDKFDIQIPKSSPQTPDEIIKGFIVNQGSKKQQQREIKSPYKFDIYEETVTLQVPPFGTTSSIIADINYNNGEFIFNLEFETNFTYNGLVGKQAVAEHVKFRSETEGFDRGNTTLPPYKPTPADQNDYYEIIQNPWSENPPKIRRFGSDSYYLNNQTRIDIFWTIDNKESYPKGTSLESKEPGAWIGGTIWSNSEGSELTIQPETAVWKNPTSSVIEQYPISKIKKHIVINHDKPINIGETAPEPFTISNASITDFVKCTYPKKSNSGKEWVFDSVVDGSKIGKENTDDVIIKSIIDLWKKKVPNYDKLALCNPGFYSTIEIEFKSPLIGITPSGLTPSQTTQNTVPPLQLNVSLPTVLDVKAKTDMSPFSVYIGPIPVTDPDNIFTDNIEEFYQEDDEFVEDKFQGLQEYFETNYNQPAIIGPDDTVDPDSKEKGTGSNNEELPPTRPDNGKLGDLIKFACTSTGGGASGKCARYTFNHANNLARAVLKKDPQGCSVAAGGNANQEGYHSNLEKLGWKRYNRGTMTKSDLKTLLETNSNWNMGDIVAYWGITSDSSYSNKGGVQYGHTQMYTNGAHGTSHPWTSDNVGNFKCSFVYNSYKVDTWKLIIFKFPGEKVS
jgi:hypothetical protein